MSKTPTEAPAPATLTAAPVSDERRPARVSPLWEAAGSFEQRAHAWRLTTEMERAKMVRMASTAIARMSWGTALDDTMRAAVSRYALEVGLDPLRHIEILGGRIYINGEAYREIVAANPDFHHAVEINIADDDRASAEERDRRKQYRIEVGCPESAKGAWIVLLHYRTRGPFRGFNWAGTGKKTANGKLDDPVGEEEPSLTALTRAWRRAGAEAEAPWLRTHSGFMGFEQMRVEPAKPEPPPPAALVVQPGNDPVEPLSSAGLLSDPLGLGDEPADRSGDAG